jgi:hypothetical protein
MRFKIIRRLCRGVLFALATLSAMSSLAGAAPDASMRFHTGLRNTDGARRLSEKQLRTALESLRRQTGFLDMRFNEAGYLTIGDRNRVAGGSGVARELLISAVDGDKIFELESHDFSPGVAFARLIAGTIRTKFGAGARILELTIQLDFADFAVLRGEREALTAFDIGFAILHELAHGVLGLKDDIARRRLGECDERINIVRRDLGLPERRYYSPAIRAIPDSLVGDAELIFALVSRKDGREKTRVFYLRWDTKSVGARERQTAKTK